MSFSKLSINICVLFGLSSLFYFTTTIWNILCNQMKSNRKSFICVTKIRSLLASSEVMRSCSWRKTGSSWPKLFFLPYHIKISCKPWYSTQLKWIYMQIFINIHMKCMKIHARMELWALNTFTTGVGYFNQAVALPTIPWCGLEAKHPFSISSIHDRSRNLI